MSTGMVIVASVGVLLWLICLYFFFTPWAMWRRPEPRRHADPLVLLYADERLKRRQRAMRRAGRIETPLGKERIGLNHEPRGKAR